MNNRNCLKFANLKLVVLKHDVGINVGDFRVPKNDLLHAPVTQLKLKFRLVRGFVEAGNIIDEPEVRVWIEAENRCLNQRTENGAGFTFLDIRNFREDRPGRKREFNFVNSRNFFDLLFEQCQRDRNRESCFLLDFGKVGFCHCCHLVDSLIIGV